MKKMFLAITLLTACILSNAQIKFGLKAGANFYQINGKDADEFKEKRTIKVGPAGGAFVNIAITEQLSVQPEVLYSSEGNLQKEGSDKIVVKLNYVNVPVMVKYKISRFYAETGPQVGFLTSARYLEKFGGNEDETDAKDSFKSINFSWGLGIGYQLPMGFGVGARVNMGLLSIADASNVKVNSSGFHVGIFYQFGGASE